MNLPSKPVMIGGAVAVAALVYFATSGSSTAHAATPPHPAPPPPLPPLPPAPTPGPDLPPLPFPTSSPYEPGYQGEGTYRVIAPSGLNVRSGPSTSYPVINHELWAGVDCEITGPLTPNQWAPVTTPTGVSGFVCFNCVEAPGGPWLARIA